MLLTSSLAKFIYLGNLIVYSRQMIKVDCHVHSRHSRMVAISSKLANLIGANESYNELEDIYKTAKKRGMDYVAITDHDVLGGALILNDKYPDVIVGEELEVKASDDGHQVHIITLGINEKNHKDLQDLRHIGLKETTDYLKANKIAHYLAHVSFSVSGLDLYPELIDEWMKYVDTIEVANGVRTKKENRFAQIIANLYNKNMAGGSDSHTLRGVGRTYTVARRASNKKQFLEELFKGNTYAAGSQGNFLKLFYDAYLITYNSFYETLLKPSEKKNRPRYKKYFLDYLALLALFPLALSILPAAAIAHSHQKGQANKIVKLEGRFLDCLSKRLDLTRED